MIQEIFTTSGSLNVTTTSPVQIIHHVYCDLALLNFVLPHRARRSLCFFPHLATALPAPLPDGAYNTIFDTTHKRSGNQKCGAYNRSDVAFFSLRISFLVVALAVLLSVRPDMSKYQGPYSSSRTASVEDPKAGANGSDGVGRIGDPQLSFFVSEALLRCFNPTPWADLIGEPEIFPNGQRACAFSSP